MNVTHRLVVVPLVVILMTGCATPSNDIPSSFQGFVGSVEGRVVSVHQGAFVMTVRNVVQLREDNKAPRPGAARNHKFAVHPDVITDEYGRRHPVAEQQAFINTLSRGDRVTLRVRHTAGNQLRILELTEEQAARLNL